MVKEFEDSQENTLVIIFDSSDDLGQGQETTLEYSIKLAASVAGYVMGHGGNVRVLTGRLQGRETPWADLRKELALLEAGDGPTLPTLLETLPAGSRVLALVSDEDLTGIKSLGRRAGHMAELAVVVFEEFGDIPSQQADLAAETLNRTGVSAVSCRRGYMPETLHSLEKLEWLTGPMTQRLSAPRQHQTGGAAAP